MPAGRPPAGPKLARKLDLSPLAKDRLEVILETVACEKTVREACDTLGIGQAYFFRIRDAAIQAAGEQLEPGTPGRPPRQTDPKDAKIAELEAKLERMEIELRAAEVRTELAVAMPHVLRSSDAPKKKGRGAKTKARRALPRRGRKRRSKA